MSGSREAIFAKIGKATEGRADASAARARLETPPAQPVPAIGKPPAAEKEDLFGAKAMELGCTVVRCGTMDDVPKVVADYLIEKELGRTVWLADDESLTALGWSGAGVETKAGTERGALDGSVAVTRARAGVAETGAVAVTSGSDFGMSLGLLPDVHVIVLRTDELVGGYEDVWAIARATRGNEGTARALSFIGGPSRTADIEATLVMGAHGPRAVHIVLVVA